MAKTDRLQLRIDASVKRRIKEYANVRGVGISTIIEGLIRRLLWDEELRKRAQENVDAEQV